MRKWAAVLLGLMALVAWAPAAHANLRFSAETSESLNYILVEGEFERADDLAAFTRLERAREVDFVTFDSPGGNVAKAIELGYLIRQAGLSTLQVRGLDCASACAFAFFGGVRRAAMPGAIGMHKVSIPDGISDPGDVVSDIQDMTAIIMGYMREMGIDPALLELALGYDADDMRYLSSEEMARYRVTTQASSVAETAREPPARETSSRAPAPDTASIPLARSGVVRHVKGSVPLKAFADEKARDLEQLPNGTRVEVTSIEGRWYRVRAAGKTGFVHQTWVFVDQFVQSAFANRYIQIKSFSDYEEAARYVASSDLPLAAMLAANGWYAITLDGTLAPSEARAMLARLKRERLVPSDSYITYGNTYVRKVCCE